MAVWRRANDFAVEHDSSTAPETTSQMNASPSLGAAGPLGAPEYWAGAQHPGLQVAVPMTRDWEVATAEDSAALVDHGPGKGVLMGIDADHVAHLGVRRADCRPPLVAHSLPPGPADISQLSTSEAPIRSGRSSRSGPGATLQEKDISMESGSSVSQPPAPGHHREEPRASPRSLGMQAMAPLSTGPQLVQPLPPGPHPRTTAAACDHP